LCIAAPPHSLVAYYKKMCSAIDVRATTARNRDKPQ
jgi:hypothetical protein